MELPPGFIRLRDTIDIVGRKLCGSNWRPISDRGSFVLNNREALAEYHGHNRGARYQISKDHKPTDPQLPSPMYRSRWSVSDVITCKRDPEIERVITMINQACEAGQIAAFYRSDIGGAKKLDRGVWRLPHWRSYFAAGTIHRNLARLDKKGPTGLTMRDEREIFLRRRDLDRFIETLSEPMAPSEAMTPSEPTTLSKRQVSKTQISDLATAYFQNDSNPTLHGLRQYARDAGIRGHRDEFDAEYRDRVPDRRVGRRWKSAEK